LGVYEWWDAQKAKSEQMLDEFVERNPNMFGVIVATATHTSMALGSGMVDLLRVGDGVSEGTFGGAAQDGLRLLGIFGGPVGNKGIQTLRSQLNLWKIAPSTLSRHLRIPRLILDRPGGVCSWVSSVKALAHVGYKRSGKLFASVDDLAWSVGADIREIGAGISLHDMAINLRKIGVSVGPVSPITNMQQATRMLPRDGSVVLMSFHKIKNGQQVGGHTMYIFRDLFGRVRLMDRIGVYSDVAALIKSHKYNADNYIPRFAAKVDNMKVKFIPSGTAVLATEVQGVILNERK
jgi:hypothetical protein